jgi:uncharacterized phage protein gp47/JayE
MSEYGVTPEGFVRKRLDVILQELNAEMKAIFGEELNLTPESPDGQVNGATSESYANLWELSELSYNARNPSAAVGAALSSLVQLNYITRLPATRTTADVTLGGTPGAVIPTGSLMSASATDTKYETTAEATLDGLGSAVVEARGLEFGEISCPAASIDTIDSPVVGWATVTNLAEGLIGTEEETDVELRARRERSTSTGAQAILDAMFAAINNIPGVTNLTILENDSNIVDVNGLPPHSFEVIVVGGDDQAIADTIWAKKSTGSTPAGTSDIDIVDSQGITHTMRLTRPAQIDIYVKVTITTFADYPADGDDLIKQAIVDYANGDLIAGRGFSVGDDVIYTRLYTPINSVPGHEIDELLIDTVFPPTLQDNIAIGIEEVSHFTIANIEVVS